MTNYDAGSFSPAAPIAAVIFVNPANRFAVADVMMLIDTGADATLVPERVCQALEVEETTTIFQVELVHGERTNFSAVSLQMRWAQYIFNGEFLVTKTEFGIIGRDILNRIRIRFDGPAQTWSFG